MPSKPSEPLDRLIELTARYRIPLVLAIIPQATGEALARRLAEERHVLAAVHGWSHANHAPAAPRSRNSDVIVRARPSSPTSPRRFTG